MTTLSTHVLDTSAGAPARDVAVVLDGGAAAGRTDADGRFRFEVDLDPGTHRITFDTSALSAFYPEVTVTFSVPADRPHVHVPLLLSPYSYSTYLGS